MTLSGFRMKISLMAKLYFRYGTVGSAKTLNLLAVAHSYEQQGKKVLLLKPKIDTRFGLWEIKSRAGLVKNADFLIDDNNRLVEQKIQQYDCILVDESQFVPPPFVDHLREISVTYDVPVICYGLRTDFKARLFDGSKRLMELADSISEIKNTCHFCNGKSLFNLKMIEGTPTFEGPQIQLGAEELYVPCCSKCFYIKQGKEADKRTALRAKNRPQLSV